ncbi:MAG: hypothetical protein HYV34_01285 [Candidatus Kerfeldbacteria bacterium]|nr:hypothetical protein [Candidatus Kerfeldbacteria bacterium]
MNAAEQLADLEISLRIFIEDVLKRKHGHDWLKGSVINRDRLKEWNRRLKKEQDLRSSAGTDKRLLSYSEFSDLIQIIDDNWDEFSFILNDRREINVFLRRLKAYRNPDAHRRSLDPHEEALTLGICTYIRKLISNHRRSFGDPKSFFPSIDSVIEGKNVSRGSGYVCQAGIVRPGDELEYTVSATDPKGEKLEYRLLHSTQDWQKSEKLNLTVSEADIRTEFMVQIWIRNPRNSYHSNPDAGYDDVSCFLYSVLPI